MQSKDKYVQLLLSVYSNLMNKLKENTIFKRLLKNLRHKIFCVNKDKHLQDVTYKNMFFNKSHLQFEKLRSFIYHLLDITTCF